MNLCRSKATFKLTQNICWFCTPTQLEESSKDVNIVHNDNDDDDDNNGSNKDDNNDTDGDGDNDNNNNDNGDIREESFSSEFWQEASRTTMKEIQMPDWKWKDVVGGFREWMESSAEIKIGDEGSTNNFELTPTN